MPEKQKVGVIGCGNISSAYFTAAKTFDDIDIVACADINMTAARKKAEEFGIKALTVEEILKDQSISIIINLTIPQAHVEVNLKILEAGKHAYCEKPFALNRAKGKTVLELAAKKGLMTGCAPDTFLGGGLQTVKKAIEDGWIGRPLAGTAFMMCSGHESWHPNPGFYYLDGGGPMLDMGPYYITALVNLLGPVKSVLGYTKASFTERVATCKELYGKKLPVEVPTHYSGTIEFVNGALINIIMSFDVKAHSHNCIEIYGSQGSIKVPDPNTFAGDILVKRANEWEKLPYSHIYTENMRSIGVADMADAINNKRENRASGILAYHVLDVMLAFEDSSHSGKRVELESTCKQPEKLPMGLFKGKIN
ncbi:MAG: Gfo/Idh/MocA family oxidoreductase [Verrucomicrobiota bacterium]|nr:Gfo/Idh/MocA family oxidoreductase [Verrucomicrobiota bacterium]